MGVLLTAGKMRLCPAHNVGSAHGPGLARHLFAVIKERQRRDAANVKARTQIGHCFSVHFCKAYLGLKLRCGLLIGWRHLAAGTAPWGPEINEYRYLVAADVFVKGCFVKRRGMRIEESLLAIAASGVIAKLVCLQPIGGVAVRADDVDWFSHQAQLVVTAVEFKPSNTFKAKFGCSPIVTLV